MFRRLHNRILASYFLVLLSCFAITLVTSSLFIRSAYFSYVFEDLKNDAGLFVDEHTRAAIEAKDMPALKEILSRAEQGYTVDIVGRDGLLLASSQGAQSLDAAVTPTGEFVIKPAKGFGYSVRRHDNGIKTVYAVIPVVKDGERIGFVRISTPVLYIEKTIHKLQLFVVLIFLLAIAGSSTVGFFLSRGISAPLLAMTRVAREVSSGNLHSRVAIEAKSDEIGVLVNAFNEMIAKLEMVQERRKDILGNISHELMTPITSIRGFVETLYDGRIQDKGKIEECLEVIKNESQHLEELIEELRFISRVDAFSVKYDFAPLNITDVILEAEKALSVKAQSKAIAITNDFPGGSFLISGDYKALRQVFVNLLDNAIKYSFNGTTILVSLKKTDAALSVIISDEGIGIDKGEQEKIFERFYRVKDQPHAEKGLGLGLAIVREILNAHHADVAVTGRLNKGSQFSVTFPSR